MKRTLALFSLFIFAILSGCSGLQERASADAQTGKGADAIHASEKKCSTEGLGEALVPGKPNIILVYGFLQTPSMMLPLKATMECRGWNVVIPDLGWNIGGTDTITHGLIGFLNRQDALLHEHYHIGLASMKDDLVLFGHSRGGLAIVNAQRMDRALMPLHVVTAGSAFGGIPLGIAIAVVSQAARDTIPGSEFLTTLRDDMRTHPRDLLQVTSRFDGLVPEYDVEGYPHYVSPLVGHMALGTDLDPRVFESRLPKYFPDIRLAGLPTAAN